jgi:hypothetical protein
MEKFARGPTLLRRGTGLCKVSLVLRGKDHGSVPGDLTAETRLGHHADHVGIVADRMTQ